VNVQLDARRSRTVARGAGRCPSRPTLRELSIRSAKVAATFTTIAVLWSLWSSPSLSAWLEMVGRGFHGS
jgi:alginate O-acetyltransferase complex protein AlgI